MRGITKLSIAAAIIGIGSLLISYIGGPTRAAVDNSPDCDTVAIMYCGAFSESQFHSKWNNDSKYRDHAAVFAAFGINKAEVTGMTDGVVWKDGRVTLADGTLVATNATTAGRWNNPTSDMSKIAGTSRAYKMSTRHFVTEGQTAMIKMVDGQFKFAVIKSCGNPVVATPQPKPSFSCDALKAAVDPKNIYKYNFTINATTSNGAKVHDYVINYGDGTATQLSKTNTFSHTYTKPGTYTIKSSVRVNVFGDVKTVTGKTCETTITIKEPAKPVAKCDALDTPVITDRTRVALSSRASATGGATISEHIFTIHDASGKQINQRRVATTATTASTYMVVPTAGTYTAKVAIRTSLGDLRAASCEKKFTIKEADKPGITIDKTVNGVEKDVVTVDEPFTYEIVVRNTGNTDLKNAKVEDKAPAGVTFRSASAGTIASNVWTHTIPTLKKGESMKFTITAIVSKYFEDGRKNTACVDAPTIPGTPDDCDDAEITVKKPGINITKLVDGVNHKAVETNVEFTYQIRVSNTGQTNLKNVVVTDEAEAAVTFISSSHGTVSDRSWTYTIAELKKGEHMDFTITAKVPEYKAGTIKNTVCVDAPTVPGNPDDCDDATVEVPEPGKEVVCRLEDKKYPVTIKEGEFDESLHSRNPADCEEPPVVTPPELPMTGSTDGLLNALGLGALTTSVIAYVASRRNSLLG